MRKAMYKLWAVVVLSSFILTGVACDVRGPKTAEGKFFGETITGRYRRENGGSGYIRFTFEKVGRFKVEFSDTPNFHNLLPMPQAFLRNVKAVPEVHEIEVDDMPTTMRITVTDELGQSESRDF